MQRSAASLTDRLAALLEPPAKLDRFDELAIDIIAEASSLSFKSARELIAARLRLLHVEGERAGLDEARKAIAS